jgi:hypothetical protein
MMSSSGPAVYAFGDSITQGVKGAARSNMIESNNGPTFITTARKTGAFVRIVLEHSLFSKNDWSDSHYPLTFTACAHLVMTPSAGFVRYWIPILIFGGTAGSMESSQAKPLGTMPVTCSFPCAAVKRAS